MSAPNKAQMWQSFSETFAGKRVLVTGHAGFCGSWLSAMLQMLGAEVAGISLEPDTTPNLYDLFDLFGEEKSHFFDIADAEATGAVVADFRPEVIFHLAAQPLVRKSYRETFGTYMSNVMGTVSVLEAVRAAPSVRAVVTITSDKVYENREWVHPYRETDPVGSGDPYSTSKACCELVIESYRKTVLAPTCQIASARGGNIIGGGDWSEDRLIPDLVRAITGGSKLTLRNPEATRPWQHVIALCDGYLTLGQALLKETAPVAASGWNFGPPSADVLPVRAVVDQFAALWTLPDVEVVPATLKEARLLALDSTKAKLELGWIPAWDGDEAIAQTVSWYKAHAKGDAALALSRAQVQDYFQIC